MQVSRARTIGGWVLTGLVGGFMIGASGVPKFLDFPGKGEMMEHLGIPLDVLPVIGGIEIAVAVLMLIPRTAFVGAILTTGYLGGAAFTHLRAGDGALAMLFPIILGVVMWTGLALRRPIVFSLAAGAKAAMGEKGGAS